MKRVSLDDIESRMGPAADKRPVASALDATTLACNYYVLEPGDSFGFGYHRHPDQEELFYVVEGTATFETEDGDVDVGPDEAIRFAPGEWQLGSNEGDERVVALAMGAPRNAGDTEMVRNCADCGERTPHSIEMADGGDELLARCDECGAVTGRFS
ncbi:MAG: cupin domain-containing protein [Haloarculaceae archaeon]